MVGPPGPNGHAHGFVLLVQTADGFTEIRGLEVEISNEERPGCLGLFGCLGMFDVVNWKITSFLQVSYHKSSMDGPCSIAIIHNHRVMRDRTYASEVL